jgi:hypothetical protein
VTNEERARVWLDAMQDGGWEAGGGVTGLTGLLDEAEARGARSREDEAHVQRYTHGKAARTWLAIIGEQPHRAKVSAILADWMAAYEAADAEAERRFRDLAAALDEAASAAGGER